MRSFRLTVARGRGKFELEVRIAGAARFSNLAWPGGCVIGICSGCRVAVGEFWFRVGGCGENSSGVCFCIGANERRRCWERLSEEASRWEFLWYLCLSSSLNQWMVSIYRECYRSFGGKVG